MNPPVFCALKCHTTNNVSEAGLMWPNEETQACDGGGRDDGLPSFSRSCAADTLAPAGGRPEATSKLSPSRPV